MDYDPQRFGKWFKRQRQEHQLTQQDVADILRRSLDSIRRIEDGKIYWAKIDPYTQSKIEDVFGAYPAHDEPQIIESLEFRYGAGTRFLDEIERQIEDIREEEGQSSDEDGLDSGNDDVRYIHQYADTRCDRCPTMLGPNDRNCPECGRPIDDSL